jgi:2-phosphoglycerate kinase
VPADLSSSQSINVRVLNRDGARLPFSRGIMANSILATGLATDQAYRVASNIQRDLDAQGGLDIEADDLAQLAAEAIDQLAGPEFSRRYRSWRTVKRMGRPIVIVLSGAPGVGKSTLATRLAVRLGVTHVVATDTIREVLRTVIAPAVLPELHASTYELDDPPASAGFERQSNAVVAATAAVANRLATERRNALLEGVHLLPGVITRSLLDHVALPVVIERLLVLDDESVHQAQLKRRVHAEPGRRGDRTIEQVSAIRNIQNILAIHAKKQGVPIFDLSYRSELTQHIVDAVVAELSHVPKGDEVAHRIAFPGQNDPLDRRRPV